MSLVNKSLWEHMLPGLPMPEGATFEMYLTAQKALFEEEHRAWAAQYIKDLVTDKRRYTKEMSEIRDYLLNGRPDEAGERIAAEKLRTLESRIMVVDALMKSELDYLREHR